MPRITENKEMTKRLDKSKKSNDVLKSKTRPRNVDIVNTSDPSKKIEKHSPTPANVPLNITEVSADPPFISSSPSILPFIEKRLLSATYVEKFSPERHVRSRTAISKCHTPDIKGKSSLPKLDTVVSRISGNGGSYTKSFVNQISWAKLRKANLLNSPYLHNARELLELHNMQNARSVSPKTQSRRLCQTAVVKQPQEKLPVTRSAAILQNQKNNKDLYKLRTALTSFRNSKPADPSKLIPDNNSCNKGNQEKIHQIEKERLMDGYKNFRCQTNIESDYSSTHSGKCRTGESLKSTGSTTFNTGPSQGTTRSKSGPTSAKIPVGTSKPPVTPLTKQSTATFSVPKMTARNMNKVKQMCQQLDRPKYWTSEVKNYYEWNTFCLFRKYRNDAKKLREQVRLLKTDKYEIDERWKEAEIFHEMIQHRRAKAAELYMKKPSSASKRKLRRRNSSLRSSRITTQNSDPVTSAKGRQQTPKVAREPLVPPPATPNLLFLVPHLSTSKRVNTTDINKGVFTTSAKGYVPAIPNGSGDCGCGRGSICHKLNKSDILELVTSYIPEDVATKKLKIRNERFSFIHMNRVDQGKIFKAR